MRQEEGTAAQGGVLRAVLTLGIGSVCTQLIPFAMSFVLSRLYVPEQFGGLGLFVNYAGILLVIASARYELAIVRARTDSEAASISFLALAVALGFCLLLYGGLGVSDALGWQYIRELPERYLLPLFVFCSALFQILLNYHNYHENYGAIASYSIFRNLIQAASRLALSFASRLNGLIWGAMVGVAGGCLLFLRRRPQIPLRLVSRRKVGYVARRYANFPKYALPSSLLNSLSNNLPVILFALYFSRTEVGYFTMTTMLFYLPISLLSTSIGQVFYRKASVWPAGETARFAWTMARFSGALAALMLGALLVLDRSVFELLLGAEWGSVRDYAVLLLPLFMLTICFSPLSLIFDVKDRQRTEMFLQASAAGLRMASILLGGWLSLSALQVALLYALSGVAVWGVEGAVIFRLVGLPMRRRLQFVLFMALLCALWLGFLLLSPEF